MAKIIGDLPDISFMTIPSLEDLQEFGAKVHPGIAALLEGYAIGDYGYEDLLMLVIGVLIAEFYQVRAREQKLYGECAPVLIDCIPPGML